MNLLTILNVLLCLFLAVPAYKYLSVRKRISEFNAFSNEIAEREAKVNEADDRLAQLSLELEKQKEFQKSKSLENDLREKSASLKISHLQDQKQALEGLIHNLQARSSEIQERIASESVNLQSVRSLVDVESKRLTEVLQLESNKARMEEELQRLHEQENLAIEISLKLAQEIEEKQEKLNSLLEQADLYSRIEGFTAVGHFESPRYLYETTGKYLEALKTVRDRQKQLIKEKTAILYPKEFSICTESFLNHQILDGQASLMLTSFNITCDFLIENVKPSNIHKTLEQIEKKAAQIEKDCATLRCGFNIEYIRLKFEECKLYFEYVFKKEEEQTEQRLIREQMKEEAKAQREYEERIKKAEMEEIRYNRLIQEIRQKISEESEQERKESLAKIALLEEQLSQAQEATTRAKSMAEQTRRGFVYVISNIGAFGENVYKIGLTRRLDPQERIDELGDASVPFPFDVHAFCFSEDAPALEKALHREFANRRVNKVNFRKEFFRVQLPEVQRAIEKISGKSVDFHVTAQARDFYESQRLLEAEQP